MRHFLLSLAAIGSLAAGAEAAIFEISGGTPADFSPGYVPYDVTIGSTTVLDPWPDPGAVTGATVSVEPGHRIDVYLRGYGADDAWSADFGSVTNAFGAGSSPGDVVRGLSVTDFLDLNISNEGSGAGFGDPRMAVQVVGGRLEFGWDGFSEGIIGEYGRFYAVPAPIPAPAALPILASALLILGALKRRRRPRLDGRANVHEAGSAG